MARTGIEFPFMREQPKFIPQHPEYERLADPISQEKQEEYNMRELQKVQNYNQYEIVYDYCESSPYYNQPRQEDPSPSNHYN